jgi:hypothetical protein
MPLSSLPLHPPGALFSLLHQRDWEGLIAFIRGGFPPNAAWEHHGTLFEMFAMAASVPIPPGGSATHSLQLGVVEQLVESGLRNEVPFGEGSPFSLPLTMCCLLGRQDFLQLLLTAGHTLAQGSRGPSPLFALCQAGSTYTGLHLPGRASRKEIIKDLLVAGASLEETDPHGFRPLQHAVRLRDAALVEDLLELGANPEGHTPALAMEPGPHWSPLAWAVFHDAGPCASPLLKRGANPWGPMHPGQTILECAGAHASPDTWQVLVTSVGMDHPSLAQGWLQAVRANRDDVLQWFASWGWNAQSICENGWNALEIAAIAGAEKSFNWLVQAGLDPQAPSPEGWSPAQRKSLTHQTSTNAPSPQLRLAWSNPQGGTQ